MVDYLGWLSGVLLVRGIPVEYVGLSLELLGEFFAAEMCGAGGATIAATLESARTRAEALGLRAAPPLEAPASWPETPAFEAALLSDDHRGAASIVSACLARGEGLIEVNTHVIRVALYSIGEEWQVNQVSVAREHMASAIAQSVMTFGLSSA